jgi:hypothetical protein
MEEKSRNSSVRGKSAPYSMTAIQDCNVQLISFRCVAYLVSEALIKRYNKQFHAISPIPGIAEMQENARKRHQEVLNMVEALSDATSSDRASSVRKSIICEE